MKQILSGGLLMAVLAITPSISMASDLNGSGLYALNGIATTLPELSDQELAKVEGQALVATAIGSGLVSVQVPLNVHANDVVDVDHNNIAVDVAVLGRTLTIQRQ